MHHRQYDREKLKSSIPGWGADVDTKDRPGIPKENYSPESTGAHWKTPEMQKPGDVKIYKSIERPRLTATFGTSCPPQGLSGKIRDKAYTLGEGRTARWVLLLMADRVNLFESIAKDIVTGKAGNPIKQMGILVELKERGQFQRMHRRRMAIAAGAGALGVIAAKFYTAGKQGRRSRQSAA